LTLCDVPALGAEAATGGGSQSEVMPWGMWEMR
jgi:hypothetical protein